jgi:hypothetical protein
MFEQYPDAQSSDTDWTADACGTPPTFSASRFILFTAAFLIMLPGSVILFVWLGDRPYGIQFASIIGYTAATILYTFSANKGMQRFLFDCPYVRTQFGRLAVRHMSFLAALFLLQTAAFSIRPHLSPWWLTANVGSRGMPPFTLVMFILCVALELAEIMSNRSLLERAHTEKNVD